MTEIDRSLPVHLYYQLKMMIVKQIERGELRPGDKVPTEEELCERYDISRTPVRQALLELVAEGMLTRRAGRGTFVAPRGETKVVIRVVVSDIRWQWPLEEAARLLNQEDGEVKLALDFTVTPLYKLHDRLSTTVAHGQAPDISILDSVWVAEFAYRQYLYPLAELDRSWVDEVRNDLYSSLIAANSFKGELYAVPTNADTTVIWYRRDWLSAEGIAPPETWEDLLTIGHHFRLPEVRARYGLGAFPLTFVGGQAGGETTTYQLLPFLWSMGGDLIAEGKIVINSAATLRALTFLRDLVFSE
ncbi:MAG: extracellular solute-binding protein, partial [Chloroflexi bacterium]|nr:extracellular solute-binding protein [Chloroflexota bacterium]